MTDRLDETNQLLFISQKFSMMRRYSPTEEGYNTIALVQYSAKASPRRVSIDDEETWRSQEAARLGLSRAQP